MQIIAKIGIPSHVPSLDDLMVRHAAGGRIELDYLDANCKSRPLGTIQVFIAEENPPTTDSKPVTGAIEARVETIDGTPTVLVTRDGGLLFSMPIREQLAAA